MSTDNLAAAAQADPDKTWTAEDIRAEHESVMASFTPIQARALARLNRAFRQSHLGNRSAREAMVEVYEQEAAERNKRRAARENAKTEEEQGGDAA